MVPATIPSPEQGVWYLGPVPIRAYALCIVAGVIACLWLGERRWKQRGGPAGTVYDVAVWAIPFGLVGARVYHVLSSPDAYFGADGSLLNALYIWRGGLGVWGAIALGGVGAWIGCRRAGVKLPPFADAAAPGIVLAQAIGRWGNWFNQELFGKPTDVFWALEIDPLNRPAGFEQFSTFHPAFLYEFLWDLGVVVLVIWVDRRRRLGHGRAFALYVAAYTAGRVWIEALRIDDAEMIGPFRLNVWTSIVVFVLAVAYIVVVGRRHPGRETSVYRDERGPRTDFTEPRGRGAGVETTPRD
ncbi:MAG: prolipoprotein diacylglyceryl transferase [Actinomycetota bacterium]|nr:prolipoprotein diacylglyceryl transferase [Actinomycetota bacterium]